MQPEKPLYDLFDEIGINVITHHHEPIFKVEQGSHLIETIPGAHTKNLFLTCPKRESFYLVTMLEDKPLDLKEFVKQEYLPRLSFAKEEDLLRLLNITPGSVTPFSVMNDANKQVQFFLDADMMSQNILNFHPLRNDMTISIKQEDFVKFLKHLNYPNKTIKLPKKP